MCLAPPYRKFLPITRGQFMAKYGKGIQKFGEWNTQKYVPHAEMMLVTEVVERYRRTPTVVGVSKDCCAICTAFLQGVNKYRKSLNLRQCHLPGSHGNHYNCNLPSVRDSSLFAGSLAVKEYIEKRIIEMIESCIPDNATETLPHWSSPEIEHSPSASLYPVKRVK